MSPSPHAAPEAQPSVLYVDDEEVNRRVFVASFQGRFPILTASSGEEALSILSRGAPTVGVLLTDHRMPGMSGVELLEQAREVAPQVVRMILTAFADLQPALDAVNRGQVGRYFVKPWSREELSSALKDGLRIFALEQRLHTVEARMVQSERLAASAGAR
jgi:two-component system NtrC family sensor kinase